MKSSTDISRFDLIQFTGYDPVPLTPELRGWLKYLDSLISDKDCEQLVIDQLNKSSSVPPLEVWLFLANRLDKTNLWAEECYQNDRLDRLISITI
jgi:hypothetical protein